MIPSIIEFDPGRHGRRNQLGEVRAQICGSDIAARSGRGSPSAPSASGVIRDPNRSSSRPATPVRRELRTTRPLFYIDAEACIAAEL